MKMLSLVRVVRYALIGNANKKRKVEGVSNNA